MEQATGLIMATVFLFSGQPDYTKLHPAEVIQLMDDGVTILKDLPPPEGDQFIWRAFPGQGNTAELTPNEEQVFELSWGGNAPRYYLAQEAPDLYRRIELADREGYSVSLMATGDAAELTVQVEATRKALVAGTYDTALGAFVGKPTLVKTVCTTSATARPGRHTVLVWSPPAGPVRPEPVQPPGIATGQVPPWAIGKWHVEAGGDATVMDLRANGTVVFSDWPDTPFPGEMTADGAVWLDFAPEGEDDRVLVIGRLNPDGTGGGAICEMDDGKGDHMWTAVRLAPPGDAGPPTAPAEPVEPPPAGPAADVPVWATGKWSIQAGQYPMEMELRANGTVVFSGGPSTPIPAEIGADGGVWLDWVPEGEDERLLVVGRLSPDGTGAGAMCQLDDEQDDALWRATRLGPQVEAGPTESPALPVYPATGPPAPGRRLPETPGIGILLAAQGPPAAWGSKTAPMDGGNARMLEVSADICAVPFGSPEWKEIRAAEHMAQRISEMIGEGKLSPFTSPKIALTNNRRGEVSFSTRVKYFLWDEEKQAYTEHATELTNSMAVTPRVFADGSVSLAVDLRLPDIAQWVRGAHDERIPITVTQQVNTHVQTMDGEPVVIDGISLIRHQRDDKGEEARQPLEVFTVITPRLLAGGEGPVLAQLGAEADQAAAQLRQCRSNVKQLCLAAHTYAQEHDGTLPTEDWPEQLLRYTKGAGAYICPAVPELETGYALNPLLAGLPLSDIKRPADLILFCESDMVGGQPGRDAEAGLTAPRHGERIVVGFVDGHVEMMDLDELQKVLQRDPFE